MFQIDESSLILLNTTTNNVTAIPFFDKIQQNSTNEERISQQFSYLSERNQNDNTSTIKVKRKYFLSFIF